MNLILIEETDFIGAESVRLFDRRHKHITEIHRSHLGDKVRIGLIGGHIGTGRIATINDTFVDIQINNLNSPPPKALPLTLLLGLPRPKVLPRVLQMLTNLGVKQIYLLNSVKVEKVYWSCHQLRPNEIRSACLLGLEQACDTILPEIHLKRLIKPFIEDELPMIAQNTMALIAHPVASAPCPYNAEKPLTLAVGPDGGFIDYEIEMFEKIGFQPVRTFERILKVETAVSSLIGRLI